MERPNSDLYLLYGYLVRGLWTFCCLCLRDCRTLMPFLFIGISHRTIEDLTYVQRHDLQGQSLSELCTVRLRSF